MDPFSATQDRHGRAARKAEFARFYDAHHPRLIALLHALHGDRAHAHRAASHAFAGAWVRWSAVGALPDPSAWVRQRARRSGRPRPGPASSAPAGHESGWIVPSVRPIFDALARLPREQRAVLVLRHVGGLPPGLVAHEERLAPDVVADLLDSAHRTLADHLAGRTADPPRHVGAGVLAAWAAREMTELTHALSHRSDRVAVEQVYRHAVRRRARLAAAAAAVVSVGGLAAQHLPLPSAPNLAPSDGRNDALPERAQPERTQVGPPAVPDSPAVPGAPPVPATAPAPGDDGATREPSSDAVQVGATSVIPRSDARGGHATVGAVDIHPAPAVAPSHRPPARVGVAAPRYRALDAPTRSRSGEDTTASRYRSSDASRSDSRSAGSKSRDKRLAEHRDSSARTKRGGKKYQSSKGASKHKSSTGSSKHGGGGKSHKGGGGRR